MNDVLISYANEDRAAAERLAAALGQTGVSVWWDRKIPPGQTWDTTIGRALEQAKCVIVLWSRKSLESRWVREEAEVAAQRGILVPALIEDVALPIGFRRIEGARLIAWNGDTGDEEFQQLLDAIRTLVDPERTGDRTPEPGRQGPSAPHGSAAPARFSRRWLSWSAAGVTAAIALVLVVRSLTTDLRTARSASTVGAQTAGTLRVWKVGSPHEGNTPDTTVPFSLGHDAEKLGARLSVEAFPAQGFAARFFDALRQNAPPDILVINNYGIINGITTKIGSFAGIGSDEAVKKRLLKVNGSLDDFLGGDGGWTFLISLSPNHVLARKLSLRLPQCQDSAPELPSELRKIVTPIASAYLEGASSVLDQYSDPSQLRAREPVVDRVHVDALQDCGAWGNDVLAFAPVIASFEASSDLGYAPTLLVLRKQAGGWRLLTAARDPISIGNFVKGISSLADRFVKNSGRSSIVPAQLLAPPNGQSPTVPQGQRFGNFTWRPSVSAEVIAEVVEFAYKNDARLFLRNRQPGSRTDEISSGSLWSTQSTWLWRVWSISSAGDIAFSESRSFPN